MPLALAPFARLLADERARLLDRIGALELEAAEAMEAPELDDSFDEEGGEGASATVEIDQRRSLIASLRAAVDEVDGALARVAAGTYGLCATCGRDIAPERLEALPTTTECIGCRSAGPLARARRVA